MKLYFYAFAVAILLYVFASHRVIAQGCVAVKNMSTCSLNWGGEDQMKPGLQISLNYRYFRSYKHFRGRHEEKERVENGTEVINNDNSINLGLNYSFNNRFSAAIFIPYVFIDRSSLYEHLGNSLTANPDQLRFHTQSAGIGDVRAIGYINTLSPEYKKGGLLLGLGVKLPTGNYKAEDDFHTKEGIVRKPVDQSIQPGDGGFGIITEIDFSHTISGNVQGYFNAMYMANPRNTNGVIRRAELSKSGTGEPIPLSNEMSVADQWMIRTGARYAFSKFLAALGGRMECIPAEDLIGDSDGFRRPGYIISAEPSLFYSTGAHTFGVNFPIAIERRRTRNTIDKATGWDSRTGLLANGDAAFADWLLSVTYAYKLAR